MPANLEKSAVATGVEKFSFHSNPKKGIGKKCSNYHTIALMSHASNVILKIFQPRLQLSVNHEVQNVETRVIKGRGIRDQIPNIHWIIQKKKKQEKTRKTSTALLIM